MEAFRFGWFFFLISSQVAASGHGVRRKDHNDVPPERSLQDVERVIIKYKEGYQSDVQSFMVQDGGMTAFSDGESMHSIPEFGILVGQVTPSLKQALEGSQYVERVEVDQPRQLHVARNVRRVGRLLQRETPYGINAVQAPQVWSAGYRGDGVKVCVIDSGIDSTHPDFSNLEGEDVFDDWNEDLCGHGTHVSGTVAATGNQRVIGVAPDATIFTVRFFGDDCGQIFSSDLINGALSCRNNGAKVISMSLGGGFPTQSEEEAFDRLFNENNILSIASAGNSGNSGREYPASYPVIISVAATDSNNNRADFSQINDEVDLAAPGVGVLSTLPRNNCVICNDIGARGGYGELDGTSMSCPHVAGVAALLFNAVPNASPQDVRRAMEQSALDLGQQGRDGLFGHGLVQAAAALRNLQGDNSPTPGPPPDDDDSPLPAPSTAPSSGDSADDDDDDFDDDFTIPSPTLAPSGMGTDDFPIPAPSFTPLTPAPSGMGTDDFPFPTDDLVFPSPSPMMDDDYTFQTPTPTSGMNDDDFPFPWEDDFWFPAPSPVVGTDDGFNFPSTQTPNDDFASLAPSVAPSSGGSGWDDDSNEWDDDSRNRGDDLWF